MAYEGTGRQRRRDEGINLSPRLVFGLLLMAAGLLFTLDNFGVVRADDWLRFWPLALVAIGVGRLNSATRGGQLGGFVWIAAGGLFLADSLDLVPAGALWPLGLVALGAYLITRAVPSLSGKTAVAAGGESQLSAFVCMSGVSRRSRTDSFRGGDFTAVMGGVEVDLRHATIAESPAVIDTFAFWGGIEIRVPEEWNVESHGLAVMGGFEDNSDHRDSDANQTLVVKGLAIMGGVEIKN
jgi:hypothetical protein